MNNVWMDIGVARDTAAQLELLKGHLGTIESAYIAPIVALARDESIVAGIRGMATKVVGGAAQAGDFLSAKADAVETAANTGWSVEGTEPGDVTAALLGAIIGAQIAAEGGSEQHSRLKALLESGEINEEEYAELLEFLRENPDFTAEEFYFEFEDTINNHGPDRMRILAAALWDRMEGMSNEEAEEYWKDFVGMENGDQMLPLAVLVAAGGLPEIPYIIALTWGEFLPNPYPLADEDWANCANMLRELGVPIDWDDPDRYFDELIGDALLPLAHSDAGIDAILGSLDIDDFNGPGRVNDRRNEVLQFLGEFYPDKVVSWAGGQADWAQNFIDQVTEGMTDEEYEEFFGRFMHSAATGMTANSMRGLAQLDRAFHTTDREVTLDVGAAVKFILSQIPIVDEASSMAFSLLGLINGGGDVTGSRIYQGEVDTRNRNLALVTLGMNYDIMYGEDPKNADAASHPAKVIRDFFSDRDDPDRPLTAAEWTNFEEAALQESQTANQIEAKTGVRPPTPLADAAEALEDAKAPMDQAYQPPSE